MNLLLVSPVLLPMTTFILCLLLRQHRGLVALISALGAAGLALAGLLLVGLASQGEVLAVQMGGWQATYGISIAIDRLSAAMVAITGIIGLATVLYGLRHDEAGSLASDFHLFVQGLLAGVAGAFITADVFNLYVWFEVLLMASFALIALGGGRRRLAGALSYVILNLVATLLFLFAAAMLYGATSTLNMAGLASLAAAGMLGDNAQAAIVLMLFAFAVKAALFPVFGWLPASYHVAGTAVSALFAGLLTKIGVYSLIRIVTLVWPQAGLAHEVLLWVACATMLVGVLGAAAQVEIRRILSFHIVSQVGYMILGLALASPLALAGAVFYLIHHIVVKANLFFVGGLAARLVGSERLAAMGGLYARRPWLAILFAIPALSLAGIPPLSGFWAKFILVRASLEGHAWIAAGVALLTGVFTLLSMSKIWNEAFLKPHPDGTQGLRATAGPRSAWIAVAALAGITVMIGLAAGPVMDYATAAAAQLGNPSGYIQAITAQGGH
ncbi:MAG: Na+/H+ antiporter subunit D [Candidatus Dactylopiibacterium carminicum]|nr:MAG: Na+/H+ antiporter subunit D [Candidatus Dactylopiibacterium carminicum]